MYRIRVPPEVRIEFGNFNRQRKVSSGEGFFQPLPRCCKQALADRRLLFPRAPRGNPESQGHEPVVLVTICNMETANRVGTDPHASLSEHTGTLHGFCHRPEKPVTVEVGLEVLGVLDRQVRHRQNTVSRTDRDGSRKCFTRCRVRLVPARHRRDTRACELRHSERAHQIDEGVDLFRGSGQLEGETLECAVNNAGPEYL